MTINPYLTLYIKTSIRGIIDINVKAKTIKLMGENIREYLCNPRIGKDFLGHKKALTFIVIENKWTGL